GRICRVVTVVARVRRADREAEHAVVPPHVAADSLRIRVEEQLRRVEAMAVARVVGAVDAVAVQLPRADVRQVAVPHLLRPLTQRNTVRLAPRVRRVEEAQLDSRRMFGEEGEVDADAIACGTERIGRSWPDFHTPVAQYVMRRRRSLVQCGPAMQVSDFDFDLPDDRIAQEPPAERGSSRLMRLDRATGATTVGVMHDLVAW